MWETAVVQHKPSPPEAAQWREALQTGRGQGLPCEQLPRPVTEGTLSHGGGL